MERINIITIPRVLSVAQVSELSGISRQAVEKSDLTFCEIFKTKKNRGLKVVVIDDKYTSFILKHK